VSHKVVRHFLENQGMRWAVWLASGGGLGYFPRFPGTMGSLLGLLLFLPLRRLSPLAYGIFLLLLFFLGVEASSRSEPFFKKKDASEIIIDEIHAMLLVSYCLPEAWTWWIAGFCVFRLFDIAKPPPIPVLEKLPKGWGVMMDDLLAALFTIASLRLLELGLRLGGLSPG